MLGGRSPRLVSRRSPAGAAPSGRPSLARWPNARVSPRSRCASRWASCCWRTACTASSGLPSALSVERADHAEAIDRTIRGSGTGRLDQEAVERVFGLAGYEVFGRKLVSRRAAPEEPVEQRALAPPPGDRTGERVLAGLLPLLLLVQVAR